MYSMIGLLVSLCHIPRENKRKEGVLFSVQPKLVSMLSLLELSCISINLLQMSCMVKFRYYEKATKFEKISNLFWQNSCFYQGFYSVVSKLVGDFFFKFLAFSEKLDFTLHILFCWDLMFYYIFSDWSYFLSTVTIQIFVPKLSWSFYFSPLILTNFSYNIFYFRWMLCRWPLTLDQFPQTIQWR